MDPTGQCGGICGREQTIPALPPEGTEIRMRIPSFESPRLLFYSFPKRKQETVKPGQTSDTTAWLRRAYEGHHQAAAVRLLSSWKGP